MEKTQEITVLTKVSLDGQWQMFLKKKPDLVVDKKPFVALTMLYHPVTYEFVSRALGRLVESGQVDNDQEFLTKSYTFFQSQKPCLGMKPPDDNFPLSCQFSPYCSIMISKSSTSISCPACSQSLKDPLDIWQDPDKISMDMESSQNDQTIKGSSNHLELESDSSRKPTDETISVKDPLADEIHPGNLEPQLPKLEPDDDQTEFTNALSSPKEMLANTTLSLNNGFETTEVSPVDHVRIKFEPKTIEQFNQYGPIGVKGINGPVSKPDRARCYICKQLVPRSSLTRHKMFRHQFGDFQCPKCCCVTPNPKRLINHLTLHHPDVAKITCPNCRQDVKRGPKGEVFLSHVALCHKIKFLWEKESNQLVQFVGKDCMDCLRSFDTEQQLQAHEAANFCYIKTPRPTNNCKFKKNSDNTFTCLKCNNTFDRLQKLRRHDQRDHYGQILVCDHCGMQFNNEISFKRHINRKHPQTDELKCKRCDFYAGDTTQLRNHAAIHEERKHLCTICGKKFVKSCNLTIHLRSHTGEKPYGCPSCNFRTATSGNLAMHVKNVHGKKVVQPFVSRQNRSNFEASIGSTSDMESESSLKLEETDQTLWIPLILNELHLIYAQSGSWFLIFQDNHDIILNDEPYFSLNMLYDWKSQQFVWRVLGRTIEKGQIESKDHFSGTCRRLFQNRKPCLGIKPKDERFPLSCRFSSTCAITVDSQASKLDVCLECQRLFLPSKSRSSKSHEDHLADPDYEPIYKEKMEQDVEEDEVGDYEPLEHVEPRVDMEYSKESKTLKETNGKRQHWKCPICNKVLNAISSLNHLRNKHGAGEFNCLICFLPFQFAKELTDHNFLVHNQNSTLECPNCQMMIELGDDGDGLITHVELCAKAKLAEKIPKIKGKQEGQIHQCDQCGKEFGTSYLLKSHQKTHSNVWLECQTCEFKTKYKQNLINHERRHVQGRGAVKNCICDLCGKALRGPECLDKHIKSIHEKSLHFPCDKCERAFTSSAMLKRHKNRFHAESDEFICKICSYRAGDHIELSDHSKVHEDPTHKCQYCTKLFRRKHHLTIHERIHKGEKPFKCDICDYASNNSGNLIKHKKFVHQQQKKTTKKPQFLIESSAQMAVEKTLPISNQHILSQQGPSLFAMME